MAALLCPDPAAAAAAGQRVSESPRSKSAWQAAGLLQADERRRQQRDDDHVRNMQKAYKPDLPLKLFLEEEARRQSSA